MIIRYLHEKLLNFIAKFILLNLTFRLFIIFYFCIMLKVLKYIIIFLLGYKIVNEIFGKKKQQTPLSNAPKKQRVETNNYSQQSNPNNGQSTFDDAETIEYEELK